MAPTDDKNVKAPKIFMVDDPALKRVYANYVSVTTANHDCNINFAFIDPLNAAGEQVNATLVAKVVIPNSLVKDVLGVIELNFDNTMKKLAEIKK